MVGHWTLITPFSLCIYRWIIELFDEEPTSIIMLNLTHPSLFREVHTCPVPLTSGAVLLLRGTAIVASSGSRGKQHFTGVFVALTCFSAPGRPVRVQIVVVHQVLCQLFITATTPLICTLFKVFLRDIFVLRNSWWRSVMYLWSRDGRERRRGGVPQRWTPLIHLTFSFENMALGGCTAS